MPNPPLSPIMINNTDVHVTTDRFCTRLTYGIKPYTNGDSPSATCKYEIHDFCKGTKVVNVKCGPDTYKIHDGCLEKISFKLGEIAKYTNDVVIERNFDPDIVYKTLIYAFNPKKLQVDLLSNKEKYDMVLFMTKYSFLERRIKNLIDRSMYADLVQYAWKNGDLFLMEMLPKLRFPNIDFVEDFKNVDEKIKTQFVKKYVERDILLEKFRRYTVWGIIAIPCVLLFLFIVAYQFDPPKR